MIDDIIAQADQLATLSPAAELRTRAPKIGEGVRLFPYRRWVILFHYESNGIDALRIANGSQDYLSWKLS